MRKVNTQLRSIVSGNLRSCRVGKFPGHGGSKRCAEALGVAPQQWSMWESGRRIPDECRLQEIATFFGVSVSALYRERSPDSGDSALSLLAGRNCAPAQEGTALKRAPFTRARRTVQALPAGLDKCHITNCVIHENHEVSVTVRLKDVAVVNFLQNRLVRHINSLE